MAPLKVLGAGFGRTGTDSLREALNKLGYKTHHMKEMFAPNRHPLVFRDAYLHPEKEVDWDMVFDGFDAAVDWPEVAFLEQLMEKYPDAKVILTERSADSWYTSVKNTIYKFAKEKLVPDDAPQHIKDNTAMINTIVLDGAFGDKPGLFEDEALMKQKFLEHNAWVKANVPADRLLVMQTTELNWEALCGFLGKDVPDEPFPRSNSTAEIKEKAAEIMKKGFENVGSVLKGSA